MEKVEGEEKHCTRSLRYMGGSFKERALISCGREIVRLGNPVTVSVPPCDEHDNDNRLELTQ